MAACFTRSAVCPAPSLRRHELVEAAPVLGQRRPARVSICCLGFLKKKAEPSTTSSGSEALAWAKDVGPVVAIVGTVASLVVAWNTVVIQPDKAQFEHQQEQMQELRKDQQKQLQELRKDQQKQLQELRKDQQKQLELLTTRLEQLLGPLTPLPERLARTDNQVDVVLKQQTALLLHDFAPRA